jgi:DNA primase
MNDILDDVFQYLDGATRYGRYICCRCCYHDDHRPSMFVYGNYFYCSSCGKRGKTSDLLVFLQGKSYVRTIAGTSIDFKSPWRKWLRNSSLKTVLLSAHTQCIERNKTAYLKKRGVTIPVIKELKLGWKDDWITFPIFNMQNQIVGATARAGETNNSPAKYCNPPAQDPNLLYIPSVERLQGSERVYLTFGILDAISLYQLGLASLSTTTGKRLDCDALSDIRKLIFVVPDHGEEIDGAYLAAQLGWRGRTVKIDWPEDCKDVNDVFTKYGDATVLSLLNGVLNNVRDLAGSE